MNACSRRGVWLRNKLAPLWFRLQRVAIQGRTPWLTGRFPHISIAREGCITVGDRCTFGSEAEVAAVGSGAVTIGSFTFINSVAGAICAAKAISIGDHCLIADHVIIFDDSFHAISPNHPRKIEPVTIGNNVWLSSYVRVMPGVTIGDHTVVGAGSVVTRNLPDRCFAAGAPARVIRRFECLDSWRRE